jgi:hypothetical protein
MLRGAALRTVLPTPAESGTFASLIGDPEGVADNLVDYIEHFSPNVRDVFDGFRMMDHAKATRCGRIFSRIAAPHCSADRRTVPAQTGRAAC